MLGALAASIRRVAVLIESSRSWGRALLAGIARYAREDAHWEIAFEPRGLESGPPDWLKDWRGDGVIARLDDSRLIRRVKGLKVPVVDLRGTIAAGGRPLIGVDNARIAQLACEHFGHLALQHVAFCGRYDVLPHFSQERGDAFARCAAGAGLRHLEFALHAETAAEEERRLTAWLAGLPRPIGLFASVDDRAFQLLQLCRRLELRVPHDVALLGVDNDLVLCQLAEPPLSSIDPDGETAGWLAAQALDQLMQGCPAIEPRLIPPKGLAARRSTDMLALEDEWLANAIRLARAEACAGMTVARLSRTTGLSRTALEHGFRNTLGRSPKQELLRVQVEAAQRLLADGTLTLKDVAQRTGFSSERYFSEAFLRETGVRPGAWRRR